MIRVLQIGMIDFHGGIESFLINYYRNTNKEKIQFDFINISNNKLCFEDEIIALGGKIYKVSNYYKHPFKYIKEVKKIIQEQNYEIVHCNMNSAVFLHPLIASKLAKAKTIISHSHNSSSDKGLIKSLLHFINKHFIPVFANTYFACSDKAGRWFYSKRIRNSNKYYIINNAIDLDKYKFNKNIRTKKRKELKIDNDTIVIGHVGRFNKQKNHLFLLNIYNEFHKIVPNSKLFLVGSGPLLEKAIEKTKELKLTNSVYFLGQRNDISELYQAMDIFLLPSLYEGLPLVGVEAQTAGLNCAFSDVITREVMLSDKVKYLSLQKKPKEWAKEILKLNINNRENINAEPFDIRENAKKLENIYFKLKERNR